MALAVKKPACPAEKTMCYEFLGTIKNPSGQLKLRSKVEVDRLDLKCKLPLLGESVEDGTQQPSEAPEWPCQHMVSPIQHMGRSRVSSGCLFSNPENGGNDLLPMSLIGNIIAIEMQLAFRVHMGVFSGQSEYSPDPAYVIPSGCPHQTKICP